MCIIQNKIRWNQKDLVCYRAIFNENRASKKNPKSSVCFWEGDPSNSVTLVGETVIRTDKETRDAMWIDWFIDHFDGGVDDPEFCVLEFTAKEATLWIDREFVTVKGDEL